MDIQYDRKISKHGMNENSYNIIKVNNYYTLTGKTGLIPKKFESRTILSIFKIFPWYFSGTLEAYKREAKSWACERKSNPRKNSWK